MSQSSSFFNGKTYNANDWANFFAGFIGTGVIPIPNTSLQVVPGTGLSVIIQPGTAYINGYCYNNTEPFTLTIPEANSSYATIVSIILELNLNNSEIILTTVTGAAQATPVAPTIVQTEGVYQLQLATVQVPASATTIGKIVDTRANTSVCGWCQTSVSSTPNMNQMNSLLNGYFLGNQTALNGTWVNDFNQICLEGIYSYQNNTPNAPAGSGWGCCVIYVGDVGGNGIEYTNGSNSWMWQICYDTNGSIYYRTAINGAGFTNWAIIGTTESPNFTGTVNLNNVPTFNNEQLFQGQTVSGQVVLNNVTFNYSITYWFLSVNPFMNAYDGHGVGAISVTLTPMYHAIWSGQCNFALTELEFLENVTIKTMTYEPVFEIGYDATTNALYVNNAVEPSQWSPGTFKAFQNYTAMALLIE